MHLYTRWILTMSLLLLCAVANASDWIRTDYSLHGVLSDNQVKVIQKDKNGFYWILTNSGWMIRWNGSRFFNEYNNSRFVSTGTLFWSCTVDNEGELIVAEQSIPRKLFKVNENSRLVYFAIPDSMTYPDCPYIGAFLTLPKKVLYRPAPGKPSYVNTPELPFESCNWVNVSYPAGRDKFFIRGYQMVYWIVNGRIEKFIHYDPQKEYAFCVDNYLIIRNPEGYSLYDSSARLIYRHTDNGSQMAYRSMFCENAIRGKLYGISVSGERRWSVYRWSVKDNRLQQYEIMPLDEETGRMGINCIYVDEEEGRILTGNRLGGMSVYSRNFFRFEAPALPDEGSAVYSLAPGTGGPVTNREMLQLLYGKKNIDYNYNGVVLRVNEGYVYAESRNIALVDNSRRLLRRHPLRYITPVRSAVELNGRIFFAGDGNYYTYDWQKDELLKAENSPEFAALPSGPAFTPHFLGDGGKDHFFAIAGDWLWRINKHSLKADSLCRVPVKNSIVRSLFFSQSLNAIFFTLTGKGVYMFLPDKGRLMQLPSSGLEELKSCHYVCQDTDSDLWLPTNFGLFLLRHNDLRSYIAQPGNNLKYYRFGKEDGLVNEEFNGGFTSCGIASGDSIIMANMHSSVSFKPGKLKQSVFGISNGKLVESGVWLNDSLLPSGIRRIKAPANFRNMKFQVDWPQKGNSQGAIEYRLMPSRDTSWQQVGNNNRVELRDLRGGKYRLEFRVPGEKTYQLLWFDIVVAKYWYETTLAYIVYSLLLFGLGLLVFSWRLHRVRNRSLLEIDKNRRELFTIISHDLRSPLKAYQGLAEVVSYLVKNKEYDRVEKIAAQIDSTGIKLDLLLNNLLNWNLLQQEKLVTRSEKINLSQIVQEHIDIYEEIAVLKGIRLLTNSTNDQYILADKEMVSLMLRNQLDNAIKNSPQQKDIEVSIIPEEEGACLQVRNAIVPAQQQVLEKVNELLQSNTGWEPGSKGMGFGLRMIYLAAKKTGALLSLTTTKESATFHIHFPQ
ncbi:MAG: HAMP domain-containing histidine kinase [Chitinophagaceae bacterium]|nr:HAMP domain-containing histidine kinase [Chitinophagaceae bacterium]